MFKGVRVMNHSMNNAMDGMNMNSEQTRRWSNSDPIIQERDYSEKHCRDKQNSEIVVAPEKPTAATRVTTWPSQFAGSGGFTQSNPLASDIIRSVFRYKWMILAIFVLVATPAIVAIWTQIVPKYRASAELRIRPIIPRLVFPTDENGMIPLYDSFVNTQVAIMRSSDVLQRVLDEQKIQKTQWYKNPPKSLKRRLSGNPDPPPMERFRDALQVRPRRKTEIVDVAFTDPSAKDARLIVDTLLDHYIQYIGEMSDEDADKLYKELVDKYEALEKDISGREKTIAALLKSLKTQDPQTLISVQRIRLDDTKARLSALRQNIAMLESVIDDSNAPAPIVASTQIKQPEYYVDPVWRGLDLNVRNLEHQIATSGLTPKHPNMIKMQKDLEFAKKMRRLQETRLDEQWSDQQMDSPGAPTTVAQWRDQPIDVLGATVVAANAGIPGLGQGLIPIAQLDNQTMNVVGAPVATTDTSAPVSGQGSISAEQQLAQAKRQEKLLDEEVQSQQKAFDQLFDTAQLLAEENNALNHKRTLFDAVRQRLEQKNMERNVRDVIASVEVLTQALTSSRPYSDRRMTYTAMVLAMSLGMGGGIAFLRASRNRTVYTLKDMPYSLQAPLLGHVPITQTKRSRKREIRKLSYGGKRYESGLIESIRLVRTTFLARLEHHGNGVVLITSAASGTGKSHFAMMLGESLARAGKKVLVIDADFRKRTLTEHYNLSEKPGFLESLYSKSADKRHIFPTETIGLSVMPAGRWNDDEAIFEQTANGVFKTCMVQFREDYDIILLDSPPIMPVADATILSSQVDGTIMVERELVSHRDDLIDALTRLVSSGGRLLGTVFVGYDDGNGKDYGYSYGYSKRSTISSS
jgi:capsular exopolysaccharide synthesis family protein